MVRYLIIYSRITKQRQVMFQSNDMKRQCSQMNAITSECHSVTLSDTQSDTQRRHILEIITFDTLVTFVDCKKTVQKVIFSVIANCRKLSVSPRGHLQTSPQMAQTQRVAWSCFSAFWELVDFYERLVREG